MGPHTGNSRLVLARYRALPRRETETEAEKVEALLNRARLTTNRGAGSVSWRGQRWRPNDLGFQRMPCLYGRGWRYFLNQEQTLGQACADLCTGGLGARTSVDQLRDRLKELRRRVSDLGALFAG